MGGSARPRPSPDAEAQDGRGEPPDEGSRDRAGVPGPGDAHRPELHRHLLKQLQRRGLDLAQVPAPEEWQSFLVAISKSYADIDRERYTLDRSVELVEREMQELNRRFQAERDRLQLIIGSVPVGILSAALDGRITMANQAMERILGYPVGRLLGMNQLDLVHPQDRDGAVLEPQTPERRRPAPAHAAPLRLVHRDGKIIHANVALAVVGEGNGPRFSIVVIEDVSERTRLELELRQAQKLESVGRLAAGIAHEINTPAQFMGDNARFLHSAFEDLQRLVQVYRDALRALGPRASAEERLRVDEAENEADLAYLEDNVPQAFTSLVGGIRRVTEIVRAMKSFADPEQHRKTAIDVKQALEDTLTVGASALAQVVVETDLPELPAVDGHLGELNQVWLSLLVNAAQAIEQAVQAGGAAGRIRIRGHAEGDFLVVTIADTGVGMPASIAQRIFEPFFTTKPVGRGTGQSLAISRAVVERHGGTLTFETELGVGTTFTLRLPFAGKRVHVADATDAADAAP